MGINSGEKAGDEKIRITRGGFGGTDPEKGTNSKTTMTETASQKTPSVRKNA